MKQGYWSPFPYIDREWMQIDAHVFLCFGFISVYLRPLAVTMDFPRKPSTFVVPCSIFDCKFPIILYASLRHILPCDKMCHGSLCLMTHFVSWDTLSQISHFSTLQYFQPRDVFISGRQVFRPQWNTSPATKRRFSNKLVITVTNDVSRYYKLTYPC